MPDNSPEHLKKFYFVDSVTTHIEPDPLKTPMMLSSANKPMCEHSNRGLGTYSVLPGLLSWQQPFFEDQDRQGNNSQENLHIFLLG